MRRSTALLMTIALTACGEPDRPTVVAVDTLCSSTTRFHASEAQRAAFKDDRRLWESLVTWLAGFNQVRDKRCLQPSIGN